MKIALLLAAIPLVAQQPSNSHSVEKEVALGRQVATSFRQPLKVVDDSSVNAYVQRIGTHLVESLADSSLPFSFEVVTGGDTREPATLPGGFIFVPLSSLASAADESEFVGMLAHAVAHGKLRHGTFQRVQVVNGASIPLLFMMHGTGMHAAAGASSTLVPLAALKSQREMELAADQFGLELTSRAGFDPAGFTRYIARVQIQDSERIPLPPRETRLAAMQQRLESLPQPTTITSGDEFRRAQQVARAMILSAAPRVPTLKR